ncbi:hypothetical protein D3C81_1777840 [compost metagenome]
MAGDFLFEVGSGGGELVQGQLIRTGRRPFHHRSQSAVIAQDRPIVFRSHFLGGKPGEMQRAPETIAAPGKMVPLDGGRHPGVDAAEDHGQLPGEDIFELFTHHRSL